VPLFAFRLKEADGMTALVPAVVDLLCMASSMLCAFLLFRSWLKTRFPLVLWTSACIVLLAVSNVLLVVDVILLPSFDSVPRLLTALAAVSVLLFGFIRET
jgi:hypothetical protein